MEGQWVPWILALVVIVVVGGLAMWRTRDRAPAAKPLPTEWAITPRPVFSTDERRVYRQLREALPHHIVLSKLPLVRFCQPSDPQEVRYWYELLGSIHVTFAICSANGRVLAAIDLDTDRGSSRRIMQIKQAVLNALRVRYLRCPPDHLPSVPELQLLVPQSSSSARGPQPAPVQAIRSMRTAPAVAMPPPPRRERATLWQDSGFFQDSFFAPDSRQDGFSNSDFSQSGPGMDERSGRGGSRNGNPSPDDDIGGVVIDTPRSGSSTRH